MLGGVTRHMLPHPPSCKQALNCQILETKILKNQVLSRGFLLYSL